MRGLINNIIRLHKHFNCQFPECLLSHARVVESMLKIIRYIGIANIPLLLSLAWGDFPGRNKALN